MERGLIAFAFIVTGGLTLVLSRPATPQRNVELAPVVVSAKNAEYQVSSDTLHRGESLGVVLARQRLSSEQAADVVAALRAYASPRTLRAGVTVAVERTPWDSIISLSIRVDPDNVVEIVPDGDSYISRLSELPVRVDTLVLVGEIRSSLYNSVMALAAPELGAQERIERVMWGIYRPFQWSIDFGLDIRRGDSYRAVYEREVRGDGSVKRARVLAAEFTNRGRTYRAVWFAPRREYFDEDGNSMKRVFLKAPVDFRRISSRFARRRYHPVLGKWRSHRGTDYAANTGTRVYTTADGAITRAGWWGGYGQVVEVRHVNGYRTRYAHLSFIAKRIRPGARVRQGQLIGHVGTTGLATGPHLHYELRLKGKALDPYKVNLPSGTPVSEDQGVEFRLVRERLLRLLDGSNRDEITTLAE